jgi:1-acyl-sn-glycerol-3-phosphate acyltransferase
LRVEGRNNVPKKGQLIAVANHNSYVDPVIIDLGVVRRVHFMGKTEIVSKGLFGLFLRVIGTFPVRRGEADRAALKRSFEILDEQKVLGLFPEGTRIRREGLGSFEPGIAFIALKSGAQIIPVGMKGTDRIWPAGRRSPAFPKVTVKIGKPFNIPEDLLGVSDPAEKKARTDKILDLIRQKLIQVIPE